MHAQIKNAAKAALNHNINPRFERAGDFLLFVAHLSATTFVDTMRTDKPEGGTLAGLQDNGDRM